MPSFDVVSEIDQQEIRNAVDQANKEIGTRFDFKGSDARVELNDKEKSLTVFADDEFKLNLLAPAAGDLLIARLHRDRRFEGRARVHECVGIVALPPRQRRQGGGGHAAEPGLGRCARQQRRLGRVQAVHQDRVGAVGQADRH